MLVSRTYTHKESKMIYASIDPGIDGAIAFFEDKELIFVSSLLYQIYGKNKILELVTHLNDIKNVLGSTKKVDRVIIEQVGAMKGQGVTSMFSFGARFGDACSLAHMLTNDIEFITPQKWKKAVGLIGQDKKQSAVMAARIYPNRSDSFIEKNNRCKDGFKYYDGRGDAVMLGLAANKMGIVK